MQRRDVGALDLGQPHMTELRQDVEPHDPPERLDRARPAVHRHMRLHVAIRQVGHRRLRGGRLRKRLLAPLQPVDDLRRLAARLLHRDVCRRPDGDPFRAPGRPALLDHVDLAAAGVDPYPESAELPIPEHRAPVLDGERVDDPLVEPDRASSGYAVLPKFRRPGRGQTVITSTPTETQFGRIWRGACR